MEKAERFERLENERLAKTLEAIRILGNCADKHNYAYTDYQVEQMITAIRAQIYVTEMKFKGGRRGKFAFDSNDAETD